jgi:hypothetical protein
LCGTGHQQQIAASGNVREGLFLKLAGREASLLKKGATGPIGSVLWAVRLPAEGLAQRSV